ncbi:hypothetical protein DDI_0891 [Dickeya dianthicola RNS04.9]|nr:hypothetical protein DDI_0891 [Dickeya dianthicola RNS04.9]
MQIIIVQIWQDLPAGRSVCRIQEEKSPQRKPRAFEETM